METAEDYIFHLDAPRERPTNEGTELSGWIAAHRPISDVRLLAASAGEPLSLRERPDVILAFPGHPHVTGFSGYVRLQDLHDGGLKIRFAIGDVPCTVQEYLVPPPTPPPWYQRAAMQLTSAGAEACLRMARKQSTRWNAALYLLLNNIRRSRGDSFRRPEADRLLTLFTEHFPDAVVVQIGANDGASGDPLAPYFASSRWTGILVEPIPHVYSTLTEQYRGRVGLAFEQAAISNRDDGVVTLYRLMDEPGKTPQWFQQLATLDRTVLLKHRTAIPDIEDRIVQELVPVITLDTLLAKHSLPRIDLFVIDTEGHDYCILQQMDFRQYHPIVIMFEHQHLPSPEKASAYSLLREHGYRWAETPEGDTIGWRFL